jgi:uncharacterized membrane protein (UPF0182 family)
MARRPPGGPFDPFEQSPFSGLQEFRIPRPSRRVWIGLAFVAGGILLLFVAAPLVGFLTDVQWFQALGLGAAYLDRVALQAWLFFLGLAVALLVTIGNVAVAMRLRSSNALRAVGIRRRTLLTGAGLAGVAVGALVSLILAASLRASWAQLALYLHYSPTGIHEPVFGQDVSFYLLTLPFLQSIAGWLLGLLFMSSLLVAVLYAWRGESFDLRLSPRALAHLSVLVGLLALVTAFSTFLDRYSLLSQHNGVVWGAGYTDVNARAPLAVLRAVLALLLALALFANVAVRRPAIIVGAVVVWVGAAILAGIYPAFVQRVTVQPAELSQESPYISREIQFTRQAFGVDHVQTQSFSGDQPVTAKAISDDSATVDNLRLWDNTQLQDTYTQLQSIRTYYSFEQIDVDRYTINGKTQQLAISARELDQGKLPQQAQSWVNQKLQYTHGYGVAASPVSAVVGEGLPDYVAKDLPPAGSLPVTRPEIYFGHYPNGGYVLAPSAEKEFDYPQGNQNVRNTYAGSHGVRMDGTTRLLWAMRTGDFNLLVSDQIQDRTEILYNRDVSSRLQTIAPFLTYDSPYPVVVNGKLYWIVDAYTSADTYPYSRQEPGADNQNYLRNSVKVVVDAYEGTATFYVADGKDPIIRGYQGAFPSLFKPLDQMPAGLQAHLRVPPKLFNTQAQVYSTYHISDPSTFYNREDVWAFPGLQPYYVLMRLPGQSQAEYLQILPFTPFNKQNLVSWLAVRNDQPHYGEMVSFVLPKDKVVFGPQQIASRIQQTPQISQDRTLLNSQGSSVIQGNLLVVPIGDSFLYFEPWYLKSTTSDQSLPELKKVILADATESGSVAYQNTLDQALSQLVGQQVATTTSPSQAPTTPTTPTTPAGGNAAQIQALTAQALQHYNAAQAALKNGDLATYANEMNQVGSLLQQIQALESGGPAPSPSVSASSPRASPAASPRSSP